MDAVIRVLVVDDQQLLRRGLVMLFGTVDGFDVVAQAAHGAEALAVLHSREVDVVQGAVAAGAAGFLLKDTSIESLAEAVRAVVAGGLVIDPRVARLALAAPGDEDGEPSVLAVLTPTEREVAALVAEGLTNQAIAERMMLAEGTVKNHVSALLRKLQAPDRTVLALTLYKALHSESRP